MSTKMTDVQDEQRPAGGEDLSALAEQLVAAARSKGVELTGPGGLLTGLTRQVLETALNAELDEHLGHERGERSGSGNVRNGSSGKTLRTDVGEVRISVPRDRAGTFAPAVVPKHAPAAWTPFGEALAAIGGALTGLLFVALSVKGTALLASRALASRAAETLVLFMTSVLIAVVLVAPQQATAIGSELVALAVSTGATLFILDRRAGHAREPGVLRFVERFSPNTITAVLIAIAGVTVIVGSGGGLYWLIPAVAASLIGGVINAWLFLVRVPS